MSRHSKNNTAHSVFTYAEKKMLENDYGTARTRLGQDSQRSFGQCHLCLQDAVDPVTCDHGHIFCRKCIMENLLAQKKAIKQAQALYRKKKDNQVLQELLKKREYEEMQVTEFERDNIQLGALKKVKTYRKRFEMDSTMTDEDKQKLEKKALIKAITHHETLALGNHDIKKNLIQTSFWMAESDRGRIKALEDASRLKKDKKPSSKMICPADNKHKIKVKTLYPLKFEGEGFHCFASKSKLTYQRVVALKTCGHVMTMDCFKAFCKDSGMCLCGKHFLPGDVIEMEQGKTSFSAHNKVEAEVYQPSFAV